MIAKGYIELDITNMKSSVASAVTELNKIDRAGDLVQSEMNKLQSASKGVGGTFQQAAEKSKALAQQIEQVKSKTAVYKQEVTVLNTIVSRSKDEQEKLSTKIEQVTGKYDKSKAKIKEVAEAHGKESEEYAKAISASEKYRNELLQLESKYEALGLEIDSSGQSITEFSTKVNNGEASISQMSRELAEAQSKAILLGGALQEAGGKLQTVGQGMSNVGGMLAIGITVPIVAAGTASVKLATDAETSFAKVSTIADETVLSYDKLKKGVTSASRDSGVEITEFNEALYSSLSAGVESGKAIEFTTGMVKLARGGFTDTAKAVDVVTSVLNAYGLSADDATSISDKLILTQNIGKTTVDELAGSLGRIIPSAKAAGVGMDDVGTTMAILTKRGIQTAEATTYYNGMLNELSKSGSIADKTLRDMSGKGFTQLVEEGKPVTEILQMLKDEAEKNGKSLADMFGSMEGGKAALSIMSDGGKEYNEVLETMKNSSGTAQTAFDKMDVTPAVKMQKEFNKLKLAGIDVGAKLLPVVTQGVTLIGDLAEKFAKLSPEQQETIIKTLAFAAATGPLLKGVGAATSGIGSMTKGVGKLMENMGKKSAAKAMEDGVEGVAKATENAGKGIGAFGGAASAIIAPVGIAAIAIGGMVAAIKISEEQSSKRIEKLAELSPKEKELSECINEQAEIYSKLNSSRIESMAGIEAESNHTQGLADELKGLADENGNVTEENRERAQVIANELSESLGLEIEMTDGVIQKYEELRNSIDLVIQKKKAEATQSATQSGYEEAIVNQTQAYKNYSEAQNNVANTSGKLHEAQASLNEIQRIYNNGVGLSDAQYEIYIEKLGKAGEEVSGLEKKLGTQSETLNKSEEAYVGYNATIQNYEGLVAAIVSGDADRINEAISNSTNNFITAETGTKTSLEKQVQEFGAKYREMEEAIKNGAPGITQESVDAMGILSDKATQELKTKTEQEKAGIIEALRSCGISAADGLGNAISEKSPEVQLKAMELIGQLSNGASLKQPEIQSLLSACGISASDSLIQGVAGKAPEVQAQAISLLSELQNAEATKRQEILSQLNALGISADDSLASGMDGNKSTIKVSATGVIDTIGATSEQRIGFITPGFKSSLESMGTTGVGGMEGVVSKSSLSAPGMQTPDWSEKAKTGRSGMQLYLDGNPLSVVMNVVKKIGGSIGDVLGFADGGIANEPSIFGEAGAEMAIPLDPTKRTRAISLYNQTGRLLGISNKESAMRANILGSISKESRVRNSENNLNITLSVPGYNYSELAKELAAALQSTPPVFNATFEIEDGDVFFDNEKVGRKQAPVISRIISGKI